MIVPAREGNRRRRRATPPGRAAPNHMPRGGTDTRPTARGTACMLRPKESESPSFAGPTSREMRCESKERWVNGGRRGASPRDGTDGREGDRRGETRGQDRCREAPVPTADSTTDARGGQGRYNVAPGEGEPREEPRRVVRRTPLPWSSTEPKLLAQLDGSPYVGPRHTPALGQGKAGGTSSHRPADPDGGRSRVTGGGTMLGEGRGGVDGPRMRLSGALTQRRAVVRIPRRAFHRAFHGVKDRGGVWVWDPMHQSRAEGGVPPHVVGRRRCVCLAGRKARTEPSTPWGREGDGRCLPGPRSTATAATAPAPATTTGPREPQGWAKRRPP